MNKKSAALLAQSLEEFERSGQPIREYLDEHPELDSEFVQLFEVIEGLSHYPTPSPTSQFRYAARSRVLTSLIDRQPVIFQGQIRRIWQNKIRKIGGMTAMPILIIATLLFSLLGGGTVYASQASLPGDLLYPVKIAIEDFRVGIAPEVSQGDVYLALAGERVEEVTDLIAEGRYEEIPTSMQRFESLVEGAADSIQSENESFEVLSQVLTKLLELEQVPPQASAAIQLAIKASSEHFGETEDPSNDPPSEPPVEPPGSPDELPSPPIDPPGPPEEQPAAPVETPDPLVDPPEPPVDPPDPLVESPEPPVDPPRPPVQPPGRP